MFVERSELVSNIRLSIRTVKKVPKVREKYVSFSRSFLYYLYGILFPAENGLICPENSISTLYLIGPIQRKFAKVEQCQE